MRLIFAVHIGLMLTHIDGKNQLDRRLFADFLYKNLIKTPL
jgi:hypothetical protein